jgi:HEAT repeat protein
MRVCGVITLALVLLTSLACGRDEAARPRASVDRGSAETPQETCARLADMLASDADESARGAAAQALGELRGDPKCAVEALVRVVREDPGTYVPDEALKALGELGPLAVSAVDDLVPLERPEDAPVDPFRVRDTLIKIGPGGIPRLVYHLRMNGPSADEDTIRTWGLASAILREFGEAGVPELAEALWDPTRRNPALITLRALGPAAEQAIPDLVKLYRQDPTTRWGVLQALYAMGGKACPARDLIEEVQQAPDTREADRRDAERALTALASCPED